jgi:hypothetical protein
MAAATPDPSAGRIAELERQVADLRRRLAALEERFLQARGDHPLDQETVKEKVKFDWQS